MGKTNSLTIPGRFELIKHVCDFVGQGAASAGFDGNGVFRVQLACDEACTNIIEHTYKAEGVGEITISWEIKDGDFIITIKDKGDPFYPKEIPPPPSISDPDAIEDFEIKVGGLGVYFIRKLMDEVTYSYNEGRGNVLTMVKRLPGKE